MKTSTMTTKQLVTAIRNQLTTVGNTISEMNLAKGERGFKAAGKKQWQIGYLTALNDTLEWIEKNFEE